MRRFATLIAAAAIVVTACSSGSTPPPSEGSPSPPPGTATPSPTPSPTPVAAAEVRFDGKPCQYLGPAVVTSGTEMTIDFAADSYEQPTAATLIVAAVKEGTTQAMIDAWFADTNGKDTGYPPYLAGVTGEMFATHPGSGTVVVILRDFAHAHAWTVDCITFDSAHIGRSAALIQVVSS